MPQFSLGQIVATPAALEALQKAGVAPLLLLARHARGDWGDLGEEDKLANDEAQITGARIFSSYQVSKELKIWIITDAEVDGIRLSTTLLLPSDY